MGKASYSLKIQAVLMRESGKGINAICRELGIQYASLILWLAQYKHGGERALADDVKKTHMSVQEKLTIVEDIINNNLTINGAVVKYMTCKTNIKKWLKAYKSAGPSGLERKGSHKPVSKKKREYTPEEIDELAELRRRNEWLEAQVAMLKNSNFVINKKPPCPSI